MTDMINLEFKKELVSKQSCFANLNTSELDVLASLVVEADFKNGETIVEQGARVDSVFIIISGTADVLKTTVENHHAVTEKVATLKDGDAIGLSQRGFYSLTGMRTATVVATSDMYTLKLSVAVFRGFALAHPHATETMRQQVERL
jgi:CRP-like cAMP-binding protein